MKPIPKPANAAALKQRQKKGEDTENIMNNIEARNISKTIGIDPTQTNTFSWFFQLLLKLRLPPHITRHLTPQKDNLLYLNELTHEQTDQHPSIHILKTFFYETLANNKTVYTFLDKQNKLLPFVEDRMLKQCIGINSKRREAEKVNLQRDESGRMVMSKLERINPDFKTLLATRSYMLKMLVEKVFTKKEILGKGKRAAAYTSVLAEYKRIMKQGQPDKDEEDEVTEDNLSLYQQIFEEAAVYYALEYGNLQNIPTRIIHSKQYFESSPQNVLKNIFLLNVRKENIELYWLARIMDCLPLPPNWTKKRGASYDSYLYEPDKLIFDIHPSYIYIMRQMNAFRSKFAEMNSTRQNYYLSMRQLNFYDYFERQYSVDMYGYIEKAEIETNEETQVKKKDRRQVEALQVSDWMVMDGVNNCPITPRTYVLIEFIEEFWRRLDFNEEPWFPAISPYGEVVWSSNINSKSIHFCPYQALLTNLVDSKSLMLPHIAQNMLKPEFRQAEDQDEQLMLNTKQYIKQREEFLDYYIQHMDVPVAYPYQIKPQHPLLDEYNYYDQIFVSPFQLDLDLVPPGQTVPLWLEKVRAKNYATLHTNLLTFNPDHYTFIKQAVGNYALDMVGQHQPHLIESLENKINRISSPVELLKFLYHITDLDLREQRKRQYLQSLHRDDDEDIFGSELSQVQIIEDPEPEPDKPQIEADLSSDSEKAASVRQKSIEEESSEEQPEVEQDKTSVKSQVIVIEARRQYAFLQDFKKKKYRKNYDLEPLQPQQLDHLIRNCAKTKIKKCKYKTGLLRHKVQKQLQIAKVLHQPRSVNEQQVDIIKKNYATTHMRSGCLPSFVDSKTINRYFQLVPRLNQSEVACSEVTEYSQFYSQIDQYETDDIQDIIAQARRDKAAQKKPKLPTVKTVSDHEQTNDSIQLEPIYQIKPEILHDPVLVHVKRLSGEINQFRTTFHSNKLKSVSSHKQLPLTIRFKTNSLKKLASQQTNNNPNVASIRNSSLKMERIQTESKLNQVKAEKNYNTEKFSNTQKPFHRICLEKTASHFLEKQAFLRKADIISIEARKSLLSKGRGLQTFISKLY